jgi:AraC family transcriptional regulator
MLSHATTWPRSNPKAGCLGDLAENLIALLADAARAIDTDRQSAKAAIAHVSQLLRSRVEHHTPAKPQSRQTASLVGWQVRRVKEYVHGHLHRPIRVEELSQVAGRSASYFSRAFRTTFGESPHAYVMRCRVRNARDLMLTTGMTFTEIALECGFSDQAHLCRNFRDLTGSTPAAWRREHSNVVPRSQPATPIMESSLKRMDQHGQH